MPSGLIQSEQLLAKRAAVGRDLAFSYLGFFDVFSCHWLLVMFFNHVQTQPISRLLV